MVSTPRVPPARPYDQRPPLLSRLTLPLVRATLRSGSGHLDGPGDREMAVVDMLAHWFASDRRFWFIRHFSAPVLLFAAFVAFVATLSGLASSPTRPRASTDAASLASAFIAEYGLSDPRIAASAAYVFDADTGTTLYQRNADEQRAMASCTKIMTALVALQHGSLDQTITVGADAAVLVNPDNSYMGLSKGEQLTLGDLLYGLLLPSANDAAVAIADGVGGTEARFVGLMNQEAAQLDLNHTHFANPHGLDAANHHTTARELAMLANLALRNPIIAHIATTHHYAIPKTA